MGKDLMEERTVILKLKFVISFAKRSEKEIKAGYDQLETGKQTIKINSPAGRYFHLQYQVRFHPIHPEYEFYQPYRGLYSLKGKTETEMKTAITATS